MRDTTIIGFSLALVCAACGTDGSEENASAEAAEDSGGTDTGSAEQCEEQATQSDCEGTSGADWRCAWVDMRTSTFTCDEGFIGSRCVGLTYQGAGCATSPACGADEGPSVYVRNVDETDVEVFVLETCEYQPDSEWTMCQWDGADVSPSYACACSC